MNKRALFAKTVVLVLALALTCGQAVFAETGATTGGNSGSAAPRMKFPDVSATHWALKHITKLALEGIIEGDDKGNYNPDSSVSQQDVIIMAIRMMGLEDEAKQNKTAYVLPFDVSDYAKPYVAEALDKKLLSIQEETAPSGSSKAWGTRTATREWVAKIVIRALGKQEDAAQLATTATAFKDNKDISASALGFINAAVNLHIVDGFEDGTFKPTGAVTRAQMATFLSRADQYLENRTARVKIGYVTQFTDKTLSLVDLQGQTVDLALSDNIVFYTVKDDAARIPSTYIKPNMKVYVIQDQGTAYYVEDLNELKASDTVVGTLSELNVDQLTLTLVTENGTQTLNISSTVSVVDQDGKGSSLGALVKGSQLELKKTGDTVDQITIKSVPVNKSGEAVIVSIDRDGAKLSWLDKATNKPETFVYSGQATVQYNGNEIGIDQLNPGDAVQYQVQNDVVTSIVVTKPVVEPQGTADQGKLEILDVNKKIITITTADNKLVSYHVADNVQVVIQGLATAGLGDLLVGDDLKIELLNGTARKITVTNRAIKAKLLSTIISYDKGSQVLTVQDASGSLNAYKLTASTSIVYEGTTVTLDTFDTFFLKGKKVDITASGDNVLNIRMASRYDGTIVQVNTATNDLTLRMEDGNVTTFKLTTYTGVDIPGQAGASITALKPGDSVRISLNPTQDQVVSVTMRKTMAYRLIAKDVANRQITVEEPFGATAVYTVGTGVSIETQAQSGLSLNDIPLNEPVSISFFGNTIDKITLLSPIRGKVTAVDAAGGKLTVLDFNNNSQVVTIGQNPVLAQNSKPLAGISAVHVGDRVEVVTDPSGKVYVDVAVAVKRTVSSYDAYAKQLILKRVNLDDQTNFDFYTGAYIHQGTQIINPNSLLDSNEVMIYLLDGKILELEKLS